MELTTHALDLGGAQEFIVALAGGLIWFGLDVHAIVTAAPGPWFRREAELAARGVNPSSSVSAW